MSNRQSGDESGNESENEEDIQNKNEFVYQDSSSEVEEWDEDTHWAVRDVNAEYQPPRGPRYLKFDWDQWKRADDTSHTWEREGSVATQDARRTIKLLDNKRLREEATGAKDPIVTPYSACPMPLDADDNNADAEQHNQIGNAATKPKRPKFAYLFTEIPQQARDLFVDAKSKYALRRPNHGLSEALPLAEHLLAELRRSRKRKFEELNIDIHTAFQDKLCGLGRAVLPSQDNRTRVKTQNHMQQRMANLKIKEIPLPSQKSVPVVPPPNLPSPIPSTPGSIATTSTKVDSPAGHTGPSQPFIRPKIVPHTPQKLRQLLQDSWSSMANRTRGAPITFSNEVNDEDIPPIGMNVFRYLEKTYMYEDDVPRPDKNFFHSCECPEGSCKPETCACQEDSMIFNDDNDKVLMYDAKGLYVFDLNVSSYVFECNEKCSCGPNCISRVAQKPRHVPINVFRTVECGWGVRSPVDIPKGTVLGLYTGTLLPRTVAREISIDDSRYLCDLDFHEDVIGNETGYTVNAHISGNWTRFVNHSCEPTCKLYAVIYDSVPEIHQPKLALVAQKTILALTEITLDYSPTYGKRGKGKQKVTDSSLVCRCGTDSCRGYIY